ncbi:hypothetical protein RRG08_003649 [Elysia crispata]|uniref:Uncharacterized protein n=1 Tax=Elysia crispata TaxID=231223 RepID=A0AAE1AV46_9GAST|nr:hypothetical protein RRG08_003649 [Elysia crispata]
MMGGKRCDRDKASKNPGYHRVRQSTIKRYTQDIQYRSVPSQTEAARYTHDKQYRMQNRYGYRERKITVVVRSESQPIISSLVRQEHSCRLHGRRVETKLSRSP